MPAWPIGGPNRFFAAATRTLSYAAGLAVPLNAQLVLLPVRHDGLPVPDGLGQRFSAAGRHETVSSLVRLAATQTVYTTVDMTEGLLPKAVAEVIVRHHPLLLVLSRPGPGAGNARLLTDAVMDLLRLTPHLLLLIPAAGWDVFPPQRLLLAVDGNPFAFSDEDHQEVLRRLLYATQSTLDVVHVTDDEHQRATTAEVLGTVRDNNLGNTAESRLHEVYNPEVVNGVMEEAARLKANILVVARHPSVWGLRQAVPSKHYRAAIAAKQHSGAGAVHAGIAPGGVCPMRVHRPNFQIRKRSDWAFKNLTNKDCAAFAEAPLLVR